jgi:hypothetical protein
MSDQTVGQLAFAGLLLVLGLLAWFLPYKWNIFKLKRSLARLFSEQTNKMIPKVIGAILTLAGITMLAATALGYKVS